MNRVSKTLFRSLLRWNRTNAALKVPISISPHQLKLDVIFPDQRFVSSIDSHEELHAHLFHTFRSTTYSDDLVDIGFHVLKLLNGQSLSIREKSLQRKVHSSAIFTQHAKFKVGQVVVNKFTNVRGIVTGWEVDAALGRQNVQLLVDMLDFDEFSLLKDKKNIFSKHTDAAHLELMTDRNLMRIHNTGLNTLFYYFDAHNGRYVPKADLMYLYPDDFKDVVYHNDLLNDDNRKAMNRVVSGVATLGKHMQVIVDEYFPQLSVDSDEHQAAAHDVLRELLISIESMEHPHPTLRCSGQECGQPARLFQQIPRGPRGQSLMTVESLSTNSFQFDEKDQKEIESAYGALFSLQEFVTGLYQMLQLRYQSHGLAFSDRLRINHDAAEKTIEKVTLHPDVVAIENQSHFPVAIFELGQVVRHKQYGYRGVVSGFDHRPILDVSKWDAVKTLRLKQDQPFYRIVPDQGDTERFLGEDSHRPYFYVAQENLELVFDPAQTVIHHQDLNKYFLDWDVDTQRFRLPSPLKYCFPSGAHAIPEDYPETSILQNWKKSLHSGAQMIVDTKEEQRRISIEKEIETFQNIDIVLLELFDQIKRVLTDVRDEHTESSSLPSNVSAKPQSVLDREESLLFTVRDLLTLLRLAPTREASLPVESMSWYVWTINADPNVSTLLRIGMSFMKRNDKKNAMACYKLASELAPNYAEAHNKLAAIYHSMDMNKECLQAAMLALEKFPEHYGAFAGQGLSHEKLGMCFCHVNAGRFVLLQPCFRC
jgi:hemimethylated DNA binding protein